MSPIFLFIVLVLRICNSYDIFISNTAQPPFQGTAVNPYSTLYSAFVGTKANFLNPLTTDEFHFIIIPSTSPYFLNDSEIVSGLVFDQFPGFFLLFEKKKKNISKDLSRKLLFGLITYYRMANKSFFF